MDLATQVQGRIRELRHLSFSLDYKREPYSRGFCCGQIYALQQVLKLLGQGDKREEYPTWGSNLGVQNAAALSETEKQL